MLASVIVGESTFDPEAFGQNISALLDFNTVGYAYGISYNGAAAVAEGTGGLFGTNLGIARNLAEENFAVFQTDTRIEVASVSKIITTVAVLHLLESQSDDVNAMLSTPIEQFLPADWIMGANVNGPDNFVTIRHLLTHTSGFFEGGASDSANPLGINFESFTNNNFQNLRAMVAAGVPNPTVTLPDGSLGSPYSYSNVNFSLLAKMIPYMRQDLEDEFLDHFSEEANLPIPVPADSFFGFLYEQYVRDNILGPSGIVDASMSVQDPNPAKGYDFIDADELIPGHSQSDFTDLGGAFGWKLSAPDLARFLNATRHGNAILTDTTRALMENENFLLGWQPSASGTDPYVLAPKTTDEFGTYYTHAGYAGNFLGPFQGSQAFQSQIAVLPGNVEVALVLNNLADNVPHSYFEVLRTSYVSAWSSLVIEGDSYVNNFELRRNAVYPTRIDIIVDGATIASPFVDVLQSLQFRGLGGDDTFLIEDLPAGTDLILDGGANKDTFTIGHSSGSTFDYIFGNLTILGGSGDQDEVHVNDANGLSDEYSIQGIDNMGLAVQGRIDATDYTPGKLFLYGGIEQLVLQANINPNQITVSDIASGMTVTIFAGFNPDTLLVHDLASDVTVNLYGGADNDTFAVWNIAVGATVNVFGDALGLPDSNDTLTLGNGNLGTVRGSVFFEGADGADLLILDDADAPTGRGYQFKLGSVTANGAFGGVTYTPGVENVRLHGSSRDDAVNVAALGATTDLELYGHDGNDIFWIAGASQNVDQVLGDVEIHGGDGYSRTFLPQNAIPEDDDQLYVRDDENAVAGNYTFNLHLDNVLVGRLNKLGSNPSDRQPNVIYDQIERTELHTGAGADTITVVAAPQFNQVSVFAGLGMDQIDVESTPLFAAAMQIFGEGGLDSIRVSPIAENLGNLRSLLSVDGGSGVAAELDTLTIGDTLSGNVAAYTLGGSSLTRPGSAGVAFGTVEHLVVSLSNAANVMTVSATVAGTTVVIRGNAGNDTLTASNLASSVFFVGGTGLDDRAFLDGTNGNDTITVIGDTMTLGAGSLTSDAENREVDGRGGMDTFNVGNGTVNSIGGGLVLRGGGDSDALFINDQDDLGNDTYTVTFNQVSKPNVLLVYHDMESLTLNAGADNNTININNTAAATLVVVNAGAGGDTIHLSPTAQNLSFINGPVTVNGQQGVDNVILHEELFAQGGLSPYTITRSTVSRSFFGGLSFDTIERLRLNLGTANNTVNVAEFNRDVLFALYGNVGADTFNVTVRPTLFDTGGRLFIDGGGNNNDRLKVAYATKPEVPAKPKLNHKKAAQPGAGTITVEYPEALYDIQYTGVEQVEIDKA